MRYELPEDVVLVGEVAVEDGIVGALHLLDDPQLPGLPQLHLVDLREAALAEQLEEAVVRVGIRDVQLPDHFGIGETDVAGVGRFILA